nr:MAG TPA: tail protein [Caudoviricetes sp.]
MSFLSKTFKYVNSLGQSITFDYNSGYIISLPEGVDTLSVNVAQAQGIGQAGSTVQSKSIQARPITINGKVVGDNPQRLKDALVTVVRPDLVGVLYAGDWHIDVVVTASPTIGAASKGAPFQFSLLAPYPYWVSGESKAQKLRGVQNGFKFPWDLSKTYFFGKIILLQYIVLQNLGQFDVPFTLDIKCIGETAENVGIQNMLTGEFLRLEKTLVKDEQVEIRVTHDRTHVTSSIDGDCRGALTLESNLYRIHTGDNAWKPTADSGLENIEMSVTFAEESAGVTVV